MDECPQCGRTDRRAGVLWGCLACKIATGVRAPQCKGCGDERASVDESGLCRLCRRGLDPELRGWMVKTFGFDSPAGLQRVRVPVGLICAGCGARFESKDLGLWMTDYEQCQKPWHRTCWAHLLGLR